MTTAGELLAREIRASGPVPFRRFMEVALYHPEHGYYRRPRDPFGKRGDFFTAEQVQPVFGGETSSPPNRSSRSSASWWPRASASSSTNWAGRQISP